MMGGKAAAQTLLGMRETGDYSKASTRQYERLWMQSFGHDFPMSTRFAEVIYRYAKLSFSQLITGSAELLSDNTRLIHFVCSICR